ncbi:hypothetical protein HMPREF1992_01989 [Selenomonas sp. oral taxon 892 str. F0426]|nr:hypothetical protein HMPREF1992_01989 [Selenomonas sp. oral taxon 892 str. F0426]
MIFPLYSHEQSPVAELRRGICLYAFCQIQWTGYTTYNILSDMDGLKI